MSTWRLLSAEIAHRRLNFALSLLAVVAAATLFVASPAVLRGYHNQSEAHLAAINAETAERLAAMQSEASAALDDVENQTRRIMRDLGFNLRIVHRDTDLSRLYANFVSLDMPEEYILRLAQSPEITKIAHLVATLKQMIDIDGEPRLLVGMAPETPQLHADGKTPMGYEIPPGKVFLGSLAAPAVQVGESLEVLGRTFEVAHVLPSHGTREEDIAIFMQLADAQALLDKPGRITEIVALGCKCKTIERIEEIREQLEAVLPEAQVTEIRNVAEARESQRKLLARYHEQAMETYSQERAALVAREQENHDQMLGLLASVSGVLTPLVIAACGLWIGLLAWGNVRERRSEIGLLRALGKTAGHIAALFLGKALLLGLAGGLIGCGAGWLLGRWLTISLLQIEPGYVPASLDMLALTLLGAPLVAAMASYLPTLAAVRQDPAVVLMDP